MIRARLLVLAAVTTAALTATVASANYKDDYMRGKNAVESGNWTEAAQYMRRAVEEQGSSKKRFKPYGTIFIPYVPHFYLGEALFHLGQCAQALQSFAESERQGVIQSLGEYQRLQEYRRQCQSSQTTEPTRAPTTPPTPVPTRGVDPELLQRAVDAARAQIEAAAREEDAVRALQRRTDHQQAWQSQPAFDQQLQRAADRLGQARSAQQLGTSNESTEDLERAAALATEAADQLRRLLQAVEAAQRELKDQEERSKEQERLQLIREIDSLATSARAVVAEYERLPQSARNTLYEKSRAVQIALDAAGGSGSMSLSRLQALREQLEDVTTVLRRDVVAAAQAAGQPTPAIPTPVLPTQPPRPTAVEGTPAFLRSAVTAFLKTDYQVAVEELGNLEALELRPRAVGYLFRAASRYFLYVEGGSSDATLRDQASADIRQARQSDASVVPFDDVFSPRFIEFFDSVR